MENDSWKPLKDYISEMENVVEPAIYNPWTKNSDEVFAKWIDHDNYIIEFAKAIVRNPLVPLDKLVKYLVIMTEPEMARRAGPDS